MPIRKYLPFAIVGLLVINLPVFIFLTQNQQDNRQNASETVSCTPIQPEKIAIKPQRVRQAISSSYSAQLKILLASYRSANVSSRTQIRLQLHQLLDARKVALIQTMRTDPKEALKQIQSVKKESDLTSLSSNCVETPMQISGIVHVEHADFNDKTSKDTYTLTTKDNRGFILHNPGSFPHQLYSGAQVTTYGYSLDQEFLVNNAQAVVVANDNPPLLQANMPTIRKIAVLLVNFSDTSTPSFTTNDVNTALSQVVAFHKENSYGKVVFSPTIYGWYQLSMPQSCSDTSTISSAAMAAANNDLNFLDFQHVMIVASFGSCNWSGLGDIGSFKRPTPDGNKLLSFSFINAPHNYIASYTMDHELGHNLGAYHAGFASDIYGDLYDTMGGFTGEMNAAHKDVIGVFTSGDLQTITSNGSYSLMPLESQTTGTKGLKIDAGTAGIYYVEFRQPLGADSVYNQQSFPGTDVFQGALIHKYLAQSINTIDTFLIDPTPVQNALTASLKLNQMYTIPGTNATIKTTSINPSGLTVSITGMESITANPTVTPTPIPTATPAKLSGSLYIDNNANGVMDTGDYIYTTPTRIELRKDDGTKTYPLVQTTTSTNLGHYTFVNLTPGTYKITAFIPSNYSISSGNPQYFQLASNDIVLDFGMKAVTSTPTISPLPTQVITSTPIPTSSPSPIISQVITPTSTPAPTDAHVALSLLLHGIGNAGDNTNPQGGGTQNPKTPQVTALLTFTDITTNTQTNLTVPFTYNHSAGNFTEEFYTPKLIPGKYTVSVAVTKYLQATYPQIITISQGQIATFPPLPLIVGDINTDNRINILDYDILIGCIQNTSCSQQELVLSDLNDDGKVDQDDLNLFLREINVVRGDSI